MHGDDDLDGLCDKNCTSVTSSESVSVSCIKIKKNKYSCTLTATVTVTCGDKSTSGKKINVYGKWDTCWDCVEKQKKTNAF